jgi:hypothetical protein
LRKTQISTSSVTTRAFDSFSVELKRCHKRRSANDRLWPFAPIRLI